MSALALRRAPRALIPALALAVGCEDAAGPQEVACDAPDIAVETWSEATGPGVQFLLPPRFSGDGTYTFGRSWIRFSVIAPGQRPEEPEFELASYRSCSTEIGGKSVLLENGTTRRTADIDEGFYIAATWSSVILGPLSPPSHLVMEGFALERDLMLEIFRAVHTVEFTYTGPGGSRPVVSISQPPARY